MAGPVGARSVPGGLREITKNPLTKKNDRFIGFAWLNIHKITSETLELQGLFRKAFRQRAQRL